MPDSPIATLENVTFGYADRPPLFKALSFALRPHEQIGLYGPNGSGKTTLLRLIMGLETPQSGKVLFHGLPTDNAQSLHRLRCGIGFVLQNSDDQLFSPTVLEDVAFGPLNLGLARHAARERAMETLESMGLEKFADRVTHRLSGGEKKMVSIASVLSMRPEALLLDEPTAFLDDDSRKRITDMLQEQNIARIVVSHDRSFLEQTACSCVCIKDGCMHRWSP
ncbi:MAG: energy-coupling factor ABC transporter ATP-binding protein [Desulfovibrio sp.]|jgi:cobalt/nickel transport system ATP-binding protein|nr:energy-coupling factor ABC transporter ATP-binding protein [Desulfovibrio sp.]